MSNYERFDLTVKCIGAMLFFFLGIYVNDLSGEVHRLGVIIVQESNAQIQFQQAVNRSKQQPPNSGTSRGSE